MKQVKACIAKQAMRFCRSAGVVSAVIVTAMAPALPGMAQSGAPNAITQQAGGLVLVRSQAEYTAAVRRLRPGDTLRLANGVWNNFEAVFTGQGTATAPITLEAETPGQVAFSGQSNLRLSGSHLIVRGIRFENGYSPTSEVISFRTDSRTLAFNSRVTDVAIINYNRPDRTQTEIWVAIFGRNNRFDHSYIAGKLTQGVTLAVRLDAPDSNANYHSIDHNLFGPRPPLGANGGETIRVGTSHNSLEDSNTRIENNWFEETSGEVEIISIKSGANVVRGNVFRRAQGNVVLRHGNGNLVENNVFYGDGEPNTGGVRIINANQIVRNNWFIGLNGTSNVSALAVMNGVPDSPPNRYHQVRNARIENNTFIAPARLTFGAGASAELSLAPSDSQFNNNLIIGAEADVFDLRASIDGISFAGNAMAPLTAAPAAIASGFVATDLQVPDRLAIGQLPDLGAQPGAGASRFDVIPRAQVGPTWRLAAPRPAATNTINVRPGQDTLDQAFAAARPGSTLLLAPGRYHQRRALLVNKPLIIAARNGAQAPELTFEGQTLFAIRGSGELTLRGLSISGADAPDAAGNAVIRAEATDGPSNYAVTVSNCRFSDMRINRAFTVLRGEPGTYARSVKIDNSHFSGMTGPVFGLGAETGGLGLYSAERLEIRDSHFSDVTSPVVELIRSGRDESTFGPVLVLHNNSFSNVGGTDGFLQLTGVQRIEATGNQLSGSTRGSLSIEVGSPTLTGDAASLVRIIDRRAGAASEVQP
jgi:poly(beta-D-mannuronate) lyase